jgi:DNA mismatch endonuclease (patch repair protein)
MAGYPRRSSRTGTAECLYLSRVDTPSRTCEPATGIVTPIRNQPRKRSSLTAALLSRLKRKRSWLMSRVRRANTGPELVTRRVLRAQGYRFRLHAPDLPGSPDVVLLNYRTAIFVHGCFWHGHVGCPRAARPNSNVEFWNKKLDSNMQRDRATQKELAVLGWQHLIVWQCELRDVPTLTHKLEQFLKTQGK